MKKLTQYLKTWYGALIVCAILFTVRTVAFNITKNDTAHDVKIQQDWKQLGYEAQPGYAEITASWAKAWSDAKEIGAHQSLKVLSLIACFLPLVWAYKFDGTDSKNNAIWISLALIAVLALAPPYIIPSKLKLSAEYTKKICLKNYVEGQNYDYLFPETDEQQPGSLDAFYKSCR